MGKLICCFCWANGHLGIGSSYDEYRAENRMEERHGEAVISDMLLDTARPWLNKDFATVHPFHGCQSPSTLAQNLLPRLARSLATTPHLHGISNVGFSPRYIDYVYSLALGELGDPLHPLDMFPRKCSGRLRMIVYTYFRQTAAVQPHLLRRTCFCRI